MNSDKKDALGFIMEHIGFGCQDGFEDYYSNLDFQIGMCDELKGIEKNPILAQKVLERVEYEIGRNKDSKDILLRSCWVANMIGTKCYSSSDKALDILNKVEDVVNVGIECDCYDAAREYYKAERACCKDPYDEDAIENFYKRLDDLDRAEEGDEDSRNILEQIKEFKENIHKSQKEYEKRPVELTSEDAKNLQNTMRSNQRPVFTPKRRVR